MNKCIILCFFCVSILFSCKKDDGNGKIIVLPIDQTEQNKLKVNQIQTLGSHNSYHKHMPNSLFNFLLPLSDVLPADLGISSLDYAHEPLDVQLNTYHMRSFEIDIYNDPNGGLFYNRKGNALVGLPVPSGIQELRQPGLKVLHIPDIDYATHFYTFKSMLTALKNWSDQHRNHVPIFIIVESKETTIGDYLGFLGFVKAIPFTPVMCDGIDRELKNVFGDDLAHVITPDQVRGSYATLEEAVLAGNWPTLGESRGKFIFVFQGDGSDDYLVNHPSLQGRAMFLMADEAGHPEAAFLSYDEPLHLQDQISELVQKGYIVRSRADESNHENRTGDYTRMNAAFNSGAQMISTDYYRPDPRYLTNTAFKNYTCKLPGGDVARINPVSAANKVSLGRIVE